MQKIADNIWILSNLDLKICMQALGYKGEMDFPVMQRESFLSERIASSVVKLNQMGFLYLEENGYQPTEQLKESFSGIINSDLKLRVLKKESMPIVFYKKRQDIYSSGADVRSAGKCPDFLLIRACISGLYM